VFDYVIQFLIFLSLISYAIDTLPNLSESTYRVLEIFEVFSVVLFSIEYVLRVYVAKKSFQYMFSFYGIIDLLSILPFYLSNAIDLRSIRAFRVFIALKIVRYNRALRRFKTAASILKEEMILFMLISFIMMFLASAGIYYFENEAQPDKFTSIFHSFWWAVVTLTTVGYGDIVPITAGGKVFTFFVLMVGIGIVTIPAGLVASALNKARRIEDSEDEQLK
jgi:voltage-gated potassium channel